MSNEALKKTIHSLTCREPVINPSLLTSHLHPSLDCGNFLLCAVQRSGVRLHPVVQVRSEVKCDLSSRKPAIGTTRQRTPVASPTRLLRFEDETEREAESRYLERQRRRTGQRETGVLVSKPDLKLYVNGRAGAVPQGAGAQGLQHVVDVEQRGRTLAVGTDQFYSLGAVLGDTVKLNVHLHPPTPEDRGRSLHRSRLNLRTETIRETYIGSVTPGESSRGVGNDQYLANKQVRRMMNKVEVNGNQVNLPQATPTVDLPINPYAPTQPSYVAPPISKGPSFLCPTSTMMSQSFRLNVTKSGKSLSQSQEEQDSPATSKPHKELQSGAEVDERSPCVEEKRVELRRENASFFSSSISGTTGQNIYIQHNYTQTYVHRMYTVYIQYLHLVPIIVSHEQSNQNTVWCRGENQVFEKSD